VSAALLLCGTTLSHAFLLPRTVHLWPTVFLWPGILRPSSSPLVMSGWIDIIIIYQCVNDEFDSRYRGMVSTGSAGFKVDSSVGTARRRLDRVNAVATLSASSNTGEPCLASRNRRHCRLAGTIYKLAASRHGPARSRLLLKPRLSRRLQRSSSSTRRG
jgi:hypothetical protein